jgi:hypothetical protein
VDAPGHLQRDLWRENAATVSCSIAVARYAFGVGLFHSFLSAGLSRRFPRVRAGPSYDFSAAAPP